jgi:DNA-binding NarL/FixJ family response regulator
MTILTPRQFRVTILVGSGMKNTEVAQVLGTTGGVVKNVLREIFERTKISSRVELALRYTDELAKGKYDQNRLTSELARLETRVNSLARSER